MRIHIHELSVVLPSVQFLLSSAALTMWSLVCCVLSWDRSMPLDVHLRLCLCSVLVGPCHFLLVFSFSFAPFVRSLGGSACVCDCELLASGLVSRSVKFSLLSRALPPAFLLELSYMLSIFSLKLCALSSSNCFVRFPIVCFKLSISSKSSLFMLSLFVSLIFLLFQSVLRFRHLA